MRRAIFELVSSAWGETSIQSAISSGATDLETQRLLYVKLGNYLTTAFSQSPNRAMLSLLSARIKSVETAFEQSKSGPSPIVLSPAFTADAHFDWLEWIRRLQTDESVFDIAAGLAISFLVETSAAGEKEDDPIPSLLSSALISEISSYWAWKAASRSPAELDAQLQHIVFNAASRIDQLENRAAELDNTIVAATLKSEKVSFDLQSDIERKVGYLEKRHLDLGTNIVQQEHALAQNQAFTQTVENNFAAFAEAVREELKINTAKRLWDARSMANQRAFTLSAVVAVVLIVIPIVAAYIYRDGIISYLHVIETPIAQIAPATTELTNLTASNVGMSPASLTVITIGRLLTVTIPIALWFWLIKLVVRYNYRSMILADDAKQRSTMMDTYFHLIEHQAASVEDRALILAALFRPAPGHGPDNVEPPDFTDFINKMKG